MVEILHNHSRRGFDTSCKVKTTLTPRAVHLTPMESLWEMRTLFLASLFQISPRWKKPSVPQKMNKQQSMEPWGSPGKREARSKELKDSSRHQAQWKKPLRELEEVMLRKRHAQKTSRSEGCSDDILERTKCRDNTVVCRHDITGKRRHHLGLMKLFCILSATSYIKEHLC